MGRNILPRWAYTLATATLIAVSGVNRVHAQGSTTATIIGIVTDSSGAAIAGASVQVKNTGTGITQNTTADAQGRFRVPNLNIGNYDVQASQMSFQTVVHTGITLTVGSELVVDF